MNVNDRVTYRHQGAVLPAAVVEIRTQPEPHGRLVHVKFDDPTKGPLWLPEGELSPEAAHKGK